MESLESTATRYVEFFNCKNGCTDDCKIYRDCKDDLCIVKAFNDCNSVDTQFMHMFNWQYKHPKRPNWIIKDGKATCSKCNAEYPADILWNFCPNCGTDMQPEDKTAFD